MKPPIARCGVWLLVAVLPIVHAPAALAIGINLNWDDCHAGGGAMNKNFACNSNSGSAILVASFDPPDGITKLVGVSAVIDVISDDGAALPSWWQLGAGGCRSGSLRLDLGWPPSAVCEYFWQGVSTGSVSYSAGTAGYPFRGRITVSVDLPEALAGPVQDGTEYYAFRLHLDNSSSTGIDACGGCIAPACIVLSALWLYQSDGLSDHVICSPLHTNLAAWQGGGGWCPGTDYAPPWWPTDCLATPTVRRSWGLIKGLYR